MSALTFSLLLLTGVASVVACSSSTDSNNTNSSLGAKCAAQPTFIECQACCGVPPSNAQAQKALEDCLCDEACKAPCESNGCSADASAPTATAECQTCLDSQSTASLCKPKAQAICDADPACKAYQACVLEAKCNDKPDDLTDGG